MKLVSKFTVGVPSGSNIWFNTPLSYFCKIMRVYAMKPEVIICGMILLIVLFYVQVMDVWSRPLLDRIHYTLGRTSSKVYKYTFKVDYTQ